MDAGHGSTSSSPEDGEEEVAGFMQKIREAAGRSTRPHMSNTKME